MAEPVVDIHGLTKTYRTGLRRTEVHAVKNLALAVPRGAIVAFVGPNGAGKTTTIHTLLGFLTPNAGRVRLFGMPPGPAALRRVGYQPEIFLPPVIAILVADQKPWQHYPGKVLDFVTPPGYTSHYQGIAWADMPAPANPRPGFRPRQRPVVDYPEARKRLYTNLFYGTVYFLMGGVLFTRRDVRLGS